MCFSSIGVPTTVMSGTTSCAQLTNISWQPHRPCWLLRWPNANVLLDCALDTTSLSYFLPFAYTESPRLKQLDEWNAEVPCLKMVDALDMEYAFVEGVPEVHPVPLSAVQMDTVDAILVSNWASLVALPFYTEGTGFHGAIYATDPTIQFGRLVIEELIEYFARCTVERAPIEWKKRELSGAFKLPMFRSPLEWRPFYSTETMESALKKITVVAFRETVSLLGTISISTYGSGFAMGSCNWVLTNELEKVAYMSTTSCRMSHTRSVDWEGLRGADRLIFTSLTRAYEPPENALRSMVKVVLETLRSGGNVLMPIQPTGIIFDFLELISQNMNQVGISLDTPIYFISPVARKALAYSNVNAEWLSEGKQNNVYEPTEPFLHGHLVKNGRLKVYESLYGPFSRDFRSPCVCFAGHPSLRIGDAAHLLEMWGQERKNAVIMTDPDYPMPEVYTPFETLQIRPFYFPIDTRIDLPQLNTTVLPDLKPGVLYVPDSYGRRVDGVNFIQYNPYTPIRFGETMNISGKTRRKRVHIHPDLVKRLEFVGNQKNLDAGYGPLRGYLCAYDNAFEIVPAMRNQTLRPRYTGKLDPPVLCKALDDRSVAHTSKQEGGRFIISTEKPTTVVTIMGDGLKTNVEAELDDDRSRILDIIGSCLNAL